MKLFMTLAVLFVTSSAFARASSTSPYMWNESTCEFQGGEVIRLETQIAEMDKQIVDLSQDVAGKDDNASARQEKGEIEDLKRVRTANVAELKNLKVSIVEYCQQK